VGQDVKVTEFILALIAQHAMQSMISAMTMNKGQQLYFEQGSSAGINAAHKSKLKMRLVVLDIATSIEGIALPGFRLHSLKGNKEGIWVIDENKNWRITLEFKNSDAYIVG